MVQSQLSAYRGSDPIWGFVALVRSEMFTGEAAVGLDPRVRLFAVEGHVYFAEREDDASVGIRLVNCGAISANQLARGAVQAGGQESLARLFQRDATIDRDAVELTIAASTESLLASIAQNAVGMPEVFPLRHHPAGMHHWLRGAQPFVAVEEVAVEEVAVKEVEPQFVEEVPVVELVEEGAAEQSVFPVLRPIFRAAEPTMPDLASPLPEPVLASFPAPTVHPEPTLPEWPRVDDEPAWAVPADARELAPLLESSVVEETPAPELPTLAMTLLPITAAELPQLASLTSIQIPPSTTNSFQPTAASPIVPTIPTAPVAVDPALPRLAAAPMSITDLKKDLKNAAAASEPWTSSAKSMAAVQIWEMVDDMAHDGKKQDPRMGNGAPQVRTRGWLRKKG